MKLFILKAGDAAEPVRAVHGDYDAMFQAQLRGHVNDAVVIQAHRDEALPALDDVDGAIITGSPQSVTEPEAWTENLAAWCRAAHAAELPVLGVCYGHQLLAYAHGGRVQMCSQGFELGTISVETTEALAEDPLLAEIPNGAAFNSVHGDEVTRLPEGAVRLGGSSHSVQQAFRLGTSTWGVQFHPEFTEAIMRTYVVARADLVRTRAVAAGRDPDAAMHTATESLRPTPLGPAILHRFGQHVRSRKR